MNIDELLEAVLLTADAALDLRANPDKDARGVAIEAHLDKGRGSGGDRPGPVAARCTSATRSSPGTPTAASARCSTSTATPSTEAGPSRPVQVLGLTSVPGAGDTFLVAAGRPHRPPDRREA